MLRRSLLFALYTMGLVTGRHALSAGIPEVFPLDIAHSSLRMTVSLAGMTDVGGTFKAYSGAITYDPGEISRSTATVIFEMSSIDTGVDERDEHLRSMDFLDVARFSKARFQSKRIERNGAAIVAIGTLSLRGVTKEIAIPFKIKSDGVDPFDNRRVTFVGQVTLKRSDFGILGPAFWNKAISDEVTIAFDASGRIYNYENLGSSDPASPGRILTAAGTQGEKSLRDRFRTLAASPDVKLTLGDASLVSSRLLQGGHPDESLALLEEAELRFASDPDIRRLDRLFGLAYMARHEYGKAAARFRRCVELNPDDAYAIEVLRQLDHLRPDQ